MSEVKRYQVGHDVLRYGDVVVMSSAYDALLAERDLLLAVKDAAYVLTGCSQATDYAPAFARLVDALDEWAGRER